MKTIFNKEHFLMQTGETKNGFNFFYVIVVDISIKRKSIHGLIYSIWLNFDNRNLNSLQTPCRVDPDILNQMNIGAHWQKFEINKFGNTAQANTNRLL